MDSREIKRIIWQAVDMKKSNNKKIELWNCKQGGCDSCQNSCQNTCESSCQTSCERSCQTGCQKSCQTNCERSCQTNSQRCVGAQIPDPGCGSRQGGGGRY